MNFYKFYKKFGLFALLAIVFIFFSIFAKHFFSVTNFINILRQISIFGTAVIGCTMVMLTGGTDLSNGGQVAFMGIVAALMLVGGVPIPVVVIVILAAGCLIGGINGLLTTKFHMPGFIATLGMMLVLDGLAYVVSGGYSVFGLPASYSWLGQGYIGPIPVPVIIFAIVAVLGTFLISKTYFGRDVYAVGGSAVSSNLAGIKVDKVVIITYILSGFTAALAALMQLSRSNSGAPGAGSDYPFDCMSAAVLGGVSMAGGRGKIWGAIIGVLIIGILNNGLQLMGCDDNLVDVVKGIILIIAVAIDSLYNYKSVAG